MKINEFEKEVNEYEKELKEIAETNRRFFNVVILKDILIEVLIPRNYQSISKGNGTSFASCDFCWFMDGCGSCQKRKITQDDFETEFFDLDLDLHLGLCCSHPRHPYPKKVNENGTKSQ